MNREMELHRGDHSAASQQPNQTTDDTDHTDRKVTLRLGFLSVSICDIRGQKIFVKIPDSDVLHRRAGRGKPVGAVLFPVHQPGVSSNPPISQSFWGAHAPSRAACGASPQSCTGCIQHTVRHASAQPVGEAPTGTRACAAGAASSSRRREGACAPQEV